MSQFFRTDDVWSRSPSVKPLTMTTEDGTPYRRSPAVEEEIAQTVCWSEPDLLAKRKSLSNEALVYNVRRFRNSDEAVCGLLMRELGQRTLRIVKKTLRGLDRLNKQDIAMQVEMEILELAIAPEASRKSEFLEVALTAAVRRRAINLREHLKHTIQGNRGRFKPKPILDLDEQDRDRKRPLEFAADTRESPESVMLAFQDEHFRDRAFEIVRAALEGEDERLLLAFRLHVVDGWPLWSPNPNVPTIARHFSLTRGQAKYLLERTRKIIAEVLTVYSGSKTMAATGVRR